MTEAGVREFSATVVLAKVSSSCVGVVRSVGSDDLQSTMRRMHKARAWQEWAQRR